MSVPMPGIECDTGPDSRNFVVSVPAGFGSKEVTHVRLIENIPMVVLGVGNLSTSEPRWITIPFSVIVVILAKLTNTRPDHLNRGINVQKNIEGDRLTSAEWEL